MYLNFKIDSGILSNWLNTDKFDKTLSLHNFFRQSNIWYEYIIVKLHFPYVKDIWTNILFHLCICFYFLMQDNSIFYIEDHYEESENKRQMESYMLTVATIVYW